MLRRRLSIARLPAWACGIITVVWTASHFVIALVAFHNTRHEFEIGFIKDSFYLGATTRQMNSAGFRPIVRRTESPALWMLDGSTHVYRGTTDFDAGSSGFGVIRVVEPGETIRRLMIPLWVCWAITFTIPVAVWTVRRRNRLRKVQSLCSTCGYDLRASTGRCPECGTPVESMGQLLA